MKVLLIKPMMHPDNVQPPLGLGYLASVIKSGGFDVRILDLELLKKGADSTERILIQNRPDVVAIQCYTYGIGIVREYLKKVKEFDSGIITILGGPQVTGSPEETLEYMSPFADYLIAGEAEFEMVKLLKALKEGVVPESNVIKAGLIENLDDIPFPCWELIDPSSYPPAPHGAFYREFPVAPVIASRGCPYNCYFCEATVLSGSRVRYRSVENLTEEILFLNKRFGVREIHFVDDNFTFRRDYVLKFCERILSKGLRLSFACPNGVRIDSIDRELLSVMKRAGFYSLSLGIESGSQRVLDRINKKINLEDVKKAVKLLNEAGICAVGFFIIGFPFESREDIERTIEFAKSLDLTLANFMLYHPLPKTVLYEEMKESNLLGDIDLNAVSFSHSAYSHGSISKRDLKYLQIKAFLSFYGRPEKFFSTVKNIRSPEHFMYVFKRIRRWLIGSWFNR